MERLNDTRRVAAGEKIVIASRGGRGFDLVSYSGSGRNAELFINGCKNWGLKTPGKKAVPYGEFGTLVKPSEYDLALGDAKEALKKMLSSKQLDETTFGTLWHKLESKDFAIRIVPGPDTIVSDSVMGELKGMFSKAKVILDKSFSE